MKRTLLTILLTLAMTVSAGAQDYSYLTTPKDSALAMQIMRDLQHHRDEPVGELVVASGKALLGQPYVAGTLDESDREITSVYLTRTDCILFAETCLDLAEAVKGYAEPSFQDFVSLIQSSRYRCGVAGRYSDRLHYTSDWIRCNEARGLLKDVTLDCGGEVQTHPVNYMTAHPQSYPRMDTYDSEVIAGVEQSLSQAQFTCIPKAWIISSYSSMLPGDIICFVTTVKGLDISHAAIYIGNGHFMHASLSKGEVVIDDKSLADYALSNKKISGIKVVRPMVLQSNKNSYE